MQRALRHLKLSSLGLLVMVAFAGAQRPRPIVFAQDKGSSSEKGDQLSPPIFNPATLPLTYKNAQYDFCFALPKSWKGYAVKESSWSGFINADHGIEPVAHGPMIFIENPRSTAKQRWQDIPIMIFTITQWNEQEEGKFFLGASPFGPEDIGRNRKYVFALPSRYNYAFPEGWEEVNKIMHSHPLTVCKGR